MRIAAAALAVVAGTALNIPASATRVAPVDWSRTVTAEPSGGFRMGNPKAKVKLVEYGSLTCPHCRTFDEEGAGPLIRNYVRTGKVSYEYRNYVRDAFDMSASIIARCNGAKGFFPLTRGLLKDQPRWTATAESAPPGRLEALQKLPTPRLVLEAARIAGLQKWAAARGLPVARSNQCLTNVKEIERLVEMAKGATDRYPDFAGTPSFLLNGKLLESTATWADLEPKLRAALGERG